MKRPPTILQERNYTVMVTGTAANPEVSVCYDFLLACVCGIYSGFPIRLSKMIFFFISGVIDKAVNTA